MFPLLQLGPFAIQVPGLILLISLYIALSIAEKEARRIDQSADAVYGIVFTALIGGIVAGRLAYVGRYLEAYRDELIGIISLNASTIDPVAGVVVGLFLALIYGRWKKLPLRPTLDVLAPGLAFFAIGFGLAHLSSGNAFGMPTQLPWAIDLWDAQRHPTQIYEMLLATVVFVVIWFIRKDSLLPGFLFLAWLVMASASRLFLEAFRGDSVVVAGGVREVQLIALTAILLGLLLIGQWGRTSAPTAS